MDLVIKNGTLVTASDLFPADVGIHAGKIVAIAQDLDADLVIDATDKLVFPGFIDSHVHFEMAVGGLVSTDDF